MDNLIEVRIAYQYGTRRIYPTCRKGSTITQLLGRKTLTDHDVALLKQLGFEFRITNQETI